MPWLCYYDVPTHGSGDGSASCSESDSSKGEECDRRPDNGSGCTSARVGLGYCYRHFRGCGFSPRRIVGAVGVFISGIGWWIRRVEPFESVGESVASAVIDL